MILKQFSLTLRSRYQTSNNSLRNLSRKIISMALLTWLPMLRKTKLISQIGRFPDLDQPLTSIWTIALTLIRFWLSQGFTSSMPRVNFRIRMISNPFLENLKLWWIWMLYLVTLSIKLEQRHSLTQCLRRIQFKTWWNSLHSQRFKTSARCLKKVQLSLVPEIFPITFQIIWMPLDLSRKLLT